MYLYLFFPQKYYGTLQLQLVHVVTIICCSVFMVHYSYNLSLWYIQLHDNLQLQLVTKMRYTYDTLQLQLFMRLHLQLVTMNQYFTLTTCHYDTLQLWLVSHKLKNEILPLLFNRSMQEKRLIWFWESVVLIVLSIIIYLCDHFPFLLILLSLVTLGYTQFGVSFNLFRWWTQMKAR